MDTKQSTANAQAALSKSKKYKKKFLELGDKYIVNEQNVCIYIVIQ